MANSINICWVRKDLRFIDNEILLLLSREKINTFFIWCPSKSDRRADRFRKSFLEECLRSFSLDLAAFGQRLFISPFGILETLHRLGSKSKIEKLYFSHECAFEERSEENRVVDFCQSKQILVFASMQSTLMKPSDLPFELSNMPFGFTSFRKQVESSFVMKSCQAPPKSLPPIEGNVPNFFSEVHSVKSSHPQIRGGERSACERLHEFIWESRALRSYKETRNGLISWNDSSKLSPWLSLGVISPRLIISEVQKFEQEVEKNESTYWIFFELLWRDYFKFFSLKHESRIFIDVALPNLRTFKSETSSGPMVEKFNLWKTAQTGDEFVDANMTELNLTGWMSNRGRQNVASFLIHTLGVSWVWGADYFERMLIDYDPDVNWGNWHYLSGQGSDPRSRVFDTQKQAQMYDPQKEYRDFWLNKKRESDF